MTPPLDLDEGYWSALLDEGEHASNGPGPHLAGWTVDRDAQSSPFSSLQERSSKNDWELARQTYDQDEGVELRVQGFNQGGLLVSWNSLRGFVPASQLIDFPVDIDDYTRRSLLSRYTSRALRLRIIEIDPSIDRLILSERAAQTQPGQRAEVLKTIQAGTACQGVVTNLCDFGAFVDVGGVEGLIHISELSWGRVGHPRDVLRSGQQVTVHIMSVNAEEGRIALSLKRLQPDPWASVEQRYAIGQVVQGTVTNVVDFGAFACIEEGLEGLIHISELAEGQFLHPRNVVKEGDRVEARILNIDGRARRLGLSLRHLNNGDGHQP
jgi:small subunit ribosomal protein S1